ncbi:hypothetical protein [Marinobacter sp. CHS3-4]|uniref:hypothetical protein n=1 Tax=Marinobacter sp. CHS3-4 TaxID=3045174 RepID=UPI0024B60C86|nr:hypothetical protein [Marinobacter sp. CHS3-4]MDI9244246.1 hypothetical protein [Marinobacter sp. CHS3-4]
MNEQNNPENRDWHDQRDWWLGVADLLATGSGHGVEKIQRIHLAIADESFQALDAFVVTRPWARVVKRSHDGISSLCYGAVRLGIQSIGAFRRLPTAQSSQQSRGSSGPLAQSAPARQR